MSARRGTASASGVVVVRLPKAVAPMNSRSGNATALKPNFLSGRPMSPNIYNSMENNKEQLSIPRSKVSLDNPPENLKMHLILHGVVKSTNYSEKWTAWVLVQSLTAVEWIIGTHTGHP